MKKSIEKPKEYESQKASTQVHEGGSYTVQNGKPVKQPDPSETAATKGAK